MANRGTCITKHVHLRAPRVVWMIHAMVLGLSFFCQPAAASSGVLITRASGSYQLCLISGRDWDLVGVEVDKCDANNPNHLWKYVPSVGQLRGPSGMCLTREVEDSESDVFMANCKGTSSWAYDFASETIAKSGGRQYCLDGGPRGAGDVPYPAYVSTDCKRDKSNENQMWRLNSTIRSR